MDTWARLRHIRVHLAMRSSDSHDMQGGCARWLCAFAITLADERGALTGQALRQERREILSFRPA